MNFQGRKIWQPMLLERKSSTRPAWRFGRRFWRLRATTEASDVASKMANDVVKTAVARSFDGASFGSPGTTRRLAKLIAAADKQSASVIGISGSRRGVGVSVTSRELAGALASFGRKTLFVDLSRAQIVNAGDGRADAPDVSFRPLAAEVRPSLEVFDGDAAQMTAGELRAALADAVQAGLKVVLDLPPVMQTSGAPDPSLVAAGLACDLIFLVCLSAETNQKEIEACVETSRIVGLKLGGLVLNDWRMPASGLIGS